MTDEVIERQGIIAQLITIHKDNQKMQELMTALLLQVVTLNALTREMLYISGTNPNISQEKMKKEMEFALKNIAEFFENLDKITKIPALPS